MLGTDQRAIRDLLDPEYEAVLSNLPDHAVPAFETFFIICDKIELIRGEAGYMKREKDWAKGIARRITSVGGFRSKQLVDIARGAPGEILAPKIGANGNGQGTVVNVNGNGARPSSERKEGLWAKMRAAKLK